MKSKKVEPVVLNPAQLNMEQVADVVKESTDIAVIVQAHPEIVIFESERYDEFYKRKKEEVDDFVPDLTTQVGRKAIASLAYGISQEKQRLDAAGKAAKEEALKTCQKVNEARRKIVADFDALRDQARKPLTEWEAQEETRKQKSQEVVDLLNQCAVIGVETTKADCEHRLERVRAIDISEGRLKEYAIFAEAAQKQAVTALTAAIVRLEKEELDRAELARLRAEHEARQAAEAEKERIAEEVRLKAEREEHVRLERERIAKEAEDRARAEAEKASREAAAQKDREHAETIARLNAESAAREEARRQEYADLAKKEEEAQAARRAEAARIEAERQAELAAARKAQEEAEAKQRAEAKRIADEENARIEAARRRQAEIDAQAEADRKLAANKAHQRALKTASKESLMERCQLTEAQAVAVVTAIVNKTIPNVQFNFVTREE